MDHGLHGMVEAVVEPVEVELRGKLEYVEGLVPYSVQSGGLKTATPNPVTVRIKFGLISVMNISVALGESG